MIFQLQNLNRSTLSLLPDCCRKCGWWQGHDDGWPNADSQKAWARSAEKKYGSWGKLALVDNRVAGLIQFGPSQLFERARRLPSGPVDKESVLMTCSLVTDESHESVRKSLLLAVLADLYDQEIDTVEAFSYEPPAPDVPLHIFERNFLINCGFYDVRASGGIQLMRLELGGAQRSGLIREKMKQSILERIKNPVPAPAPSLLCCSSRKRLKVPGS